MTYDAKEQSLISGTGFFVRSGEVVTNLHVIRGAHRVEVHTLEGKGRTYPVKGTLAVDDEADVALLSVDVPGVGNIVQITAPVSHGNSGSPLFNMHGQVVGIVTVKVTNGQNINLALGAPRVAALTRGQLVSFDQLATKNRSTTQPEVIAELWYRGGIDSLWLGNYESALNYFETAANRNPRRPETWIQIGYCKVKQGHNDEAIRAYQRALALRPTSAEAYNKLGDAHYYAGRFKQAIEAYQHAARLRPDQPEAYYNLGLAYLEIGDRDSAMAQSRMLEPIDAELNRKLLAELQR